MAQTTVEAKEYAENEWDWKLTIRSDKISTHIENGSDIVPNKNAVKTQVLAVLNALAALDPSIAPISDVKVQPLTATEVWE